MQGLSQDPALRPLPRVDVCCLSSAHRARISRLQGGNSHCFCDEFDHGAGVVLTPGCRKLKGAQAEEGRGGHLVPGGERGFCGPRGNPRVYPRVSAEESSRGAAAVTGMTVSGAGLNPNMQKERGCAGVAPVLAQGTREVRCVACRGGERSPH